MNRRAFTSLVTFLCIFISFDVFSQIKDPISIYRAEREKSNSLVHTKLKVDFNFDKLEMNGEAWITLQPYYYETKKLSLDAKAMRINEVSINGTPLKYNYNDEKLVIQLNKIYQKEESYTVYINYVAQPEKVKQIGSNSITAAKGLYFINPDGLEKNKPTQIWTQGETEASSCWFPTIDAPNQKTSQEIYITVPNKYKTLSNGTLISQTTKGSLRTDYWKMNEVHAPYLFFMGVGEFEVIQDRYKNIPISYYVEKKYAPYAKEIFGKTPEMMKFFEGILGVEYPWDKYAQMVGRDFVSGAMENTTAVIHNESAYQEPGELIDGNKWENTIAHELFHHWFGNLVTTESWSNLALNESFASYGEYLWREYKYGKEDADAHLYNQIKTYKEGQYSDENLVRFYYQDKEDLFDVVSYNKGAAIIHMLRNYVGDKAFFEGLRTYLTRFKFKSAEVHQLRLIFEEITGKDLNWFFNQWFYGSGHPKIQVSYDYNFLEKTVSVNFFQIQLETFSFPMSIDIYEDGKKTRHRVFVDSGESSFIFQLKDKTPDLIVINSDGALLADFVENKLLNEFIVQLKKADHYTHKRNALLEVAAKQDQRAAFNAIAEALNDSYFQIRKLALENINLSNKFGKRDVIDKIKTIAATDKSTLVKAAAIEVLGKLLEEEMRPVFEKGLQHQSYAIQGKSLVALYYLDPNMVLDKAKTFPFEVKQKLAFPLTKIYIESKDESQLEFIASNVLSGMYLNNDQATKALFRRAFEWIAKSPNVKAIENLVADIVAKGKEYQQYNFDKVGLELLREMVQFQEKEEHSSLRNNIRIIKTGIAELATL